MTNFSNVLEYFYCQFWVRYLQKSSFVHLLSFPLIIIFSSVTRVKIETGKNSDEVHLTEIYRYTPSLNYHLVTLMFSQSYEKINTDHFI